MVEQILTSLFHWLNGSKEPSCPQAIGWTALLFYHFVSLILFLNFVEFSARIKEYSRIAVSEHYRREKMQVIYQRGYNFIELYSQFCSSALLLSICSKHLPRPKSIPSTSFDLLSRFSYEYATPKTTFSICWHIRLLRSGHSVQSEVLRSEQVQAMVQEGRRGSKLQWRTKVQKYRQGNHQQVQLPGQSRHVCNWIFPSPSPSPFSVHV